EFIIGYILLSVWAVDIFAMFTGKIIGGPKLAPVISPKKTWAGLFGGMVGGALAAVLSFLTVVGFGFGQMQFTSLVLFAPLLAIVAQAADLFESAIKRRFNVKDSGAIIPGHGGLLLMRLCYGAAARHRKPFGFGSHAAGLSFWCNRHDWR
ncbi:phosphatidate cytidylyltransferase, partial [Alphaproteobacteria bacterium]|nr:phosphatidate cytidylyltransferase [Alphaproteobacteria bacterium]